MLKNSSSNATTSAPTRPVSWLLAPVDSATAVRDPLVETAKPWKTPAAMFAVPMPIISWLGSTSSPRRAAKAVAVAMVSVSETSVMPAAATSIGATSSHVGPRQLRAGQALRQGTHRRDVEIEQRGHDGRADHRDQHGGDRPCDAREQEQHCQRAEPDHERRRVALVETREERLDFLDEAVGVGRESEELGELADDDRDRQPVHVADLHLLRQKVGDETELAEPETDQDQPDQHGHHPGERDGLLGVVGHRNEREDGGEDERRHR